MGYKVVRRQMYCFVVSQGSNLRDDEFVIESFGHIEIHPRSLLQGQMGEVPIVAVKGQHMGVQPGG